MRGQKEMGELTASLQLRLKDLARMLALEKGKIILHWYHMMKYFSLKSSFGEQIQILAGTLGEQW